MLIGMTPRHKSAQAARKRGRAQIDKAMREFFGKVVPPGLRNWTPTAAEDMFRCQLYEILDQAITQSVPYPPKKQRKMSAAS